MKAGKEGTHVVVGRPINGISLNACEWLINEDGSDMIFKNQVEAETFLLKNGFTKEDLEGMIFLEVKD